MYITALMCNFIMLLSVVEINSIQFNSIQKAGRWANACRFEGFTLASIKKDAYMCSLNFIGDIEFTLSLNHVHYNLSIVHG